MASFTSPFNLREHLHPPSWRLNPMALADVILSALILALVATRLPSPGETIDLPLTSKHDPTGIPAAAVLTVKSDNMLFFDGAILTPEEFGREAGTFLERRNIPPAAAVLLVNLHREASVQTFQRVIDLAREAGFTKVQLAAENRVREDLALPSLSGAAGTDD